MRTMTRVPAAALTVRFRRIRPVGAWLFVALLLLVAAERRLAEFHFNVRTGDVGIESEDTLDADEIRTRLIVIQDDKIPAVEVVSVAVAPLVMRPWRRPVPVALGAPAPRGPPLAPVPHVA
jgi:hypothetical protein